MKRITYLVIILIAACIAGGCNKLAGAANAGLGGTSVLSVIPTNPNTGYVDSCIVYIKYNATSAPSSNVYDDSAVCVMINNIPTATFSNLNVGNYYLFAKGYQTGLTPPYLSGGQVYTILHPGGSSDIYLATSQGI